MNKAIEFKDGEAKVDFLQLVQTAEFEGRMARMAARAVRPARRSLERAGFKLATGIWSGEKLAWEYRCILVKKSRQSSTMRQHIRNIGDRAIQECVYAAELDLRTSMAAAKAPEQPARKPRTTGKAAASREKKPPAPRWPADPGISKDSSHIP